MWIDNATIFLSCIALLVSLINLLIEFRVRSKERHLDIWNKIKELEKTKIEIKKLKLEGKDIVYLQNNNIETYLRKVVEMIKGIYPESDPNVSIKLISKNNAKELLDGQVMTWYTYPDKSNNIKMTYNIKENTDFSSIIKDSSEYFFVSDLKKYNALNSYFNENKDFIQQYNTSIVVPIQKKDKNGEDVIGFLCIDSREKLGNVEKNRSIIEIVKSAASNLYEYLSQNGLREEVYSIKK